MSDINEGKINCQLLNLSNKNVLNRLEYIAFNSNSKIVLTIQKQIINSYFFKNNYLKHMSSIKVLRNGKEKLRQLEYLQTSNSILTTNQQKILVANLNGFNARKFLFKNNHKLQGHCQELLLNKIQSHLFLSNRNKILFFEKRMDGWKCSQEIEVSNSDDVISMWLNCQDDELLIQANNGNYCSAKIYIYHKQTQQQEIKWILIQTIGLGNGIGKLWGGFIDRFYLVNDYGLNIFQKQNQSQDYIRYASQFQNCYSSVIWQILQEKLVLLFNNSNMISVMKINQQDKLEFIKTIEIDVSLFNVLYMTYSQIKSFLTQDEKFLIIWSHQITLIIEIQK